MPAENLLANTFSLPVRVYWEDTDAGGVVYYANYLRFYERARSEWLRARGVLQQKLAEESGILFVVRSVNVDYLRPAILEDDLVVTAAVSDVKRASFEMVQDVRRNGELLSKATVKVACISRDTGRPCPLPETVLAVISAPQNNPCIRDI